MARIIGVRDLYVAPLFEDNGVDKPTWMAPVKVPSLMNIDIADQSENVTFYSDDVVEQVIPAFSGKEVTIELGYIHPRIEAMISGNTYENGIYKQNANSIAPEVAIMFRAPKSKCNSADVKEAFRYVTLFKGILARNEEGYQGKQDTIESSNVTLTGLFMPLSYNGEVERRADNDVVFGTADEVAQGTADVDEQIKADYNTMIEEWFLEVTVDDLGAAPFKAKKVEVKEEKKVK